MKIFIDTNTARSRSRFSPCYEIYERPIPFNSQYRKGKDFLTDEVTLVSQSRVRLAPYPYFLPTFHPLPPPHTFPEILRTRFRLRAGLLPPLRWCQNSSCSRDQIPKHAPHNIFFLLDITLFIRYNTITNGARHLMGLVVRPWSHRSAGNFPATFIS